MDNILPDFFSKADLEFTRSFFYIQQMFHQQMYGHEHSLKT